MALLKKIIKADPREVIVKWTGSGADTLTLASLISTNQTVTGTPAVAIKAISVSSTGATTITRNSQVAFQIANSYEFQTNGTSFAIFDENSSFDIVVNLAAAGQMILILTKLSGYSAPTL